MTLKRMTKRKSRLRGRSIYLHWTRLMKSLSIEKTRRRIMTSQVSQAKKVHVREVVHGTCLKSQV